MLLPKPTLCCLLAILPVANAHDGNLFSLVADFQPEAPVCSTLPDQPVSENRPAQPSGLTFVLLGAPSQKRLFGVIPNYRADQLQESYKPLSTHEKFKIARSDSFDWPNYLLLAGYAVQSQVAAGGFAHNGGMTGFAKFYTRSLGDQIIGNYITEAILPSLLHEDPRFFRSGVGPLWRRAGYAASRIFIARTDNGAYRFNISEIAGNAGVIAITSAYYPNSRAASESLERFSMQLGNDMISNLLTEFWPDVKRHLHFRSHH